METQEACEFFCPLFSSCGELATSVASLCEDGFTSAACCVYSFYFRPATGAVSAQGAAIFYRSQRGLVLKPVLFLFPLGGSPIASLAVAG